MEQFADNFDFVDLFEKKLCDYTGFKYAVCVDCCTNGILISLIAKNMLGEINPSSQISIPKWTYMSVPMTLKNNGFKITLSDNQWNGFYEIGDTKVYDSATDLHERMNEDYKHNNSLVCVSFQQKKRLSLGRGGVILFNDSTYDLILRRLRYDGRNPRISDNIEIKNNPQDIICGYHCYMEPDKAMRGILQLNQKQLLRPYIQNNWKNYTDISSLQVW